MHMGGFEKLQFDKASICSTIPIDAVVIKAEQPVLHPKGLIEIPSLHSVIQAMSMLCKKKGRNCFVYVKFPLGMVDYNHNRLKQLQLYHIIN